MLVTILTTAEVIYLVLLGGWILLEKRSPVATLAWLLSLVALPYVGFVVFFLLGPRRIRRNRLKHKRARGKLGPAPNAAPSVDDKSAAAIAAEPRVTQLVGLVTRMGEPPPARCEDVAIFHDAASTYDAIERAIGEAKHHVHVAYYIFDDGVCGARIRDALIAKAREGVAVRLLVDDVGSSGLGRRFIEPMREAGVKFARFNPVTLARVRSRLDFRNHRKIVVCDGVVGFTGGINVTDDYLPRTLPSKDDAKKGYAGPWRDTHVRFVGDAVRWLQLTFLDDWNWSTGYVPRDAEYFPAPKHLGEHFVQVVASGPDRDDEPIQKLYFAAMAAATDRVYITTPYFVPDDAVLTAIVTAALRGVDVRVLVPRRSDSLIVTAAARSYYDAILAAGVRVYEYQPVMIHAKTLVVDDFFASVGTANMDNRSFRLNFEVTAILYGKTHAEVLAEQFLRDLEQCEQIGAKHRANISLGWKFAEAGARILSPLL